MHAEQTHRDRAFGFATRAIHYGQEPDATTGAVAPILSLATTYKQDGVNQPRGGFEYSRAQNPTRAQLETVLAGLENAEFANAFASGLAALAGLMSLFAPGDHIIAGDDLYGGTARYFDQVLSKYGIEFSYIDATNLDALERAIAPNTKLIYLESPTNPMLRLADIRAVSELAKRRNVLLAVDNTFATPYLQRPLELGADVVLHSSTKYLGGHSDIVGGALMTNRRDLYEKFQFHQKAVGAVPSPFDCWLLMRSIKTLALRMEKHCENALAVAQFLERSGAAKKVYYPGLPSNPFHELAKRQMPKGFGGMVSVDLGGRAEAEAFIKELRLFIFAESLGGVESLACFPWEMTHASVPIERRLKLGLTEGLIRLSVGIEDKEDLINELERALSAAQVAVAT
ncbi:MAG: PLP-dependent aspartate aminotransferase family protein [Chloroherpetonaceae bacterium]|nr:PLP-dependent aspartate aminotransferase family protein [Chloroherpetonaceae bacterium]MDW8436696.1 PLP-dependent aspartate aminotransferase family protein [Chloroherpetonaceae bacterium]